MQIPPRGRRLQSLDALRGITIAAMILVNNPGSWGDVYAPLEHAAWNGWTPADLIFPFFLFITGVAVTLSAQQGRLAGAASRRRFLNIARRTLLLFGLGLFLNGFPLFDWSALRIPGVLQRVALCYGCASVIVLSVGVRRQCLLMALLVVGYLILLALAPGAPAAVDGALLGGHLLRDGVDPEGLLSTLPAIATTLAGALTGHWLRMARDGGARVAGLAAAGALAVVLGLLMDRWCPINKTLWSSSFVVFTAGMALCGLAACAWLIDVKGYRRWATPLLVYGTNPIVAYVLSSLMAKELLLWRVSAAGGESIDVQRYLFQAVFLPIAAPAAASLLYAVAYVMLWLGITGFLYRQHVQIKI